MNAKKAQKVRGYKIIKQKQNRWYAERQEQQKRKKVPFALYLMYDYAPLLCLSILRTGYSLPGPWRLAE